MIFSLVARCFLLPRCGMFLWVHSTPEEFGPPKGTNSIQCSLLLSFAHQTKSVIPLRYPITCGSYWIINVLYRLMLIGIAWSEEGYWSWEYFTGWHGGCYSLKFSDTIWYPVKNNCRMEPWWHWWALFAPQAPSLGLSVVQFSREKRTSREFGYSTSVEYESNSKAAWEVHSPQETASTYLEMMYIASRVE